MYAKNSSFLTSRNNWFALAVVLFGLALAPLLSHSLIDHPPEYDELLHVLAARGIADTGEPVIESGEYTRAELYTRLVQKFRGLHSDELVAYRLPALLFAMLLAGTIGLWVAKRIGWLAGATAAMIFVITPPTINLALIVRFYTLHSLIVLLMFIILYEASSRLRDVRFTCFAIISCVVLALLAFQIHDITLISVGAALAGLIYLLLFNYRDRYLPAILSRPLLSILGVLGAIAALICAAWLLGVVDQLRHSTPVWSESRASNFGFYFASLGTQMPFVWPLFPLMALAAVLEQKRFGGYLLVIVIVAFVANSIASQKATRYIYHFYPLICIIWGVGFQYLVNVAATAISLRTRFSINLSSCFVLALSLLCISSTEEIRRTLKLMLGRELVNDVVSLNQKPNWIEAKATLDPILENTQRVIASSGYAALYAFDRYAYELHATVVAETDTGEEFGVDRRSGKQVISTADSIQQVIDMDGSELIVVEVHMLNKPYGVNTEAVKTINSNCSAIELPESTRLSAWRCP